MTALSYTLVGNEDGRSILVFVPGEDVRVADDSHPKFADIVEGALRGDVSVLRLFDIAEDVSRKLREVSDRVALSGRTLTFDGEAVHGTIQSQILRFLDAGEDDWKPLVRFLEKLSENPSRHSRTQLYDWLSAMGSFSITPDGDIVGYKGVQYDADNSLVSVNTGTAYVDGERVSGHIPNPLGAIVSMPRNQVQDNPAEGCSYGLHVGTYDYAKGWARGALLAVHVNPADVVSVPTDCDFAKLRTCAYRVVQTIDAPDTRPIAWTDDPFGDDSEDWGDGEGLY